MARVFNFSAGPAMLPEAALAKAQTEMLDYRGSGMSVMEMSHRSKDYLAIIQKTEKDLRTLMNIPDNYKVLFLQGGASTQFAMVPLNLFSEKRTADFINTGMWSKKAISESKRYGKVNLVASSEDKNFNYIPEIHKEMFNPDADFVHITSNNTIFGTVYPEIPDTGNVPLACDMSSNILSQEYDVAKFGVIYAGAQKNIGPAGLTIVIIREDLAANPLDITPTMLKYSTHIEGESMYNTPPTYAIYLAGLVFEWMLEMGGIKTMEKVNREKAAMLYNYLDGSQMFSSTVKNPFRSIMNVPFVLSNAELDDKFLKEASKEGLKTLKGHRSVGGMRASIYNAMPKEGVEKLVEFMRYFEKQNN
jgi:phosphoserine aminotransferase